MRHIALLLLWPLTASAQTAKPEESSSLEGHVRNAATGEPAGKVSLVLTPAVSSDPASDWMRSYAASSDSTGAFAIRNIVPGKYRLRASRNGFVTIEYGARSPQRSGTILDLDSPRHIKDIVIPLTPHGVIAGRVLDADGEPLAGAQVQLLRSQYINGRKVLATAKTAYPNDLGEYRWPGLAPGKYYIYAENHFGLPSPPTATEEYVPVYYPNSANATGAIPVVVTAGAQVRADFLLRKAPTATAKGRVLVDLPDARGIPSVRFGPQSGHNNAAASSFRSLSAKVNPAGEFEIRNLAPGTYVVMAEISKGGLGFPGWTTVDVPETGIEGIVVTIGGGVSVTGRIRAEGESKQGFPGAAVSLRRGDPTIGFVSWGRPNRIAPDRTFKIENLHPGRYGILIDGLPEGFYTKSIRVADVDVTYTGIDLTFGAPGQVDILVSPKAGIVSGAVRSPRDGPPTAGATVVLIPKEKERAAIPAFYRQATADEYGRFTLKSVAPGEYKVYAWEDVESTAWLDPDFMKPLEAKGTSVTVAESAQANVQVGLIPAEPEN